MYRVLFIYKIIVMKALNRNFINIEQKNPFWSTYVCFYIAIAKGNYSEKIIRYWFFKLVDKNDYSNNEVRNIVRYLCKASEEGIKPG